jgi:hypothetical protein
MGLHVVDGRATAVLHRVDCRLCAASSALPHPHTPCLETSTRQPRPGCLLSTSLPALTLSWLLSVSQFTTGLCINMVWYADDKARSKVKADGSEGVPEKGEPYKWVYDGTKSILLYDFYPYATHCPNSIGVFNATCYILVRWCGLPGQYRWILTSFIAPTLLFIGGDLIPLLKKGGMSVEYRLNLMQCIRLWLMRIGLYSIIFCASCLVLHAVGAPHVRVSARTCVHLVYSVC